MSFLCTRDGVYRPSEDGALRDDPRYLVKAGDSWLNPANTQEETQDRYAEYGIEPERP